MKSIRLNKELRAEIKSNIEQAYIIKNAEPVVAEPIEDLYKACEALYRERSATIDKLSVKAGLRKYISCSYVFSIVGADGWSKSIYLKDVNGNNEDMPILNTSRGVDFSLTNPNPEDEEFLVIMAQYKKDTKAHRPNKVKHSAWLKAKSNYMADVGNVLGGVNTTGQLLEVWPEVEKFLPVGIADPSKIGLPSVNIAQLNKLI